MTKFKGGFKYFINGVQVKDYDAWEKVFKSKINIVTEVKQLEVHLNEI